LLLGSGCQFVSNGLQFSFGGSSLVLELIQGGSLADSLLSRAQQEAKVSENQKKG
jgi:hypothetical protein